MKKIGTTFTALAFAVALLAPASLLAQDEKENKEKKEKDVREKKDLEQIIITRTNKDEKVVVEINGDKITINGKSVEEYKNEKGVGVSIHKLRSLDNLARIPGMSGNWNFNGNDNFTTLTEDANRAMLGVTTDEADNKGAEVNTINKESAAEKMGLKEGDIITKVDEKNVADPDDLTAAIRSHKPGEKVTVTYLRDKKEYTATGELGKWKTQAFKSMDMGTFDKVLPKLQGTPRMFSPNGSGSYSWSSGGPKLGLSVQDTDDGKGVKVIEVDDESNAAKAGIKKDDVVTEVDGKAVNTTDDMVKMIKESKDKTSIMVKLQRAGKIQNIEVKIPRKIKTIDM
ncbi:MAG TPA: PDZ domain-containing protein [Chitinophagaceae bacterium]|jgi:serine protease Do|nr:PDZ domain-containing protein [Chitinophagaceae bacterium]